MAKLVIGPHVIGGSPPVSHVEVEQTGKWEPVPGTGITACGPVRQIAIELVSSVEIFNGDNYFITIPVGHRPPGTVFLEANFTPEDAYDPDLYFCYFVNSDGSVMGPIQYGGYPPNYHSIKLYGTWITEEVV
ncbi:MAG: hypothetical protein LBL55_11100 [Propionibacteriaceae bacterium]|jgi:hypothetical protein|nr:hypothetical protein [Propionibacteriaceae bacterium]